MAKGTYCSSGPERMSGTSGAPKSHVVSSSKPSLSYGTTASKSSAMGKHPGAFKSRPGRGNTA